MVVRGNIYPMLSVDTSRLVVIRFSSHVLDLFVDNSFLCLDDAEEVPSLIISALKIVCNTMARISPATPAATRPAPRRPRWRRARRGSRRAGAGIA